MRLVLTILITKIIIKILRATGHHGSALPGLIAQKIYPGVLGLLSKRFPKGVILITGTNGKTTTAKIVRKLLEQKKLSVLANRSGSNYTRGILSTFIDHASFLGKLNYDIAVIEVDEAYMTQIAKMLKPKSTVVLNVMRDQLDRYGEIDNTANIICKSLEYSDSVVLNYNDPRVFSMQKTINEDKKTTIFSVANKFIDLLPDDDSLHGETGNKDIELEQTQIELIDINNIQNNKVLKYRIDEKVYDIKTKLEGIHNYANISAAIATIYQIFGEFDNDLIKTIEQINPAFGRGEKIQIDKKNIHLSLIKNPAGFNQNLRAFVKDNIGIIILVINDRYADGRDVSWLWDADVSNIGRWHKNNRKIYCGGIRAYDIALRLQQEDIKVDVISEDVGFLLSQAIEEVDVGKDILVLPTYTAMLSVRKILLRLSKARNKK